MENIKNINFSWLTNTYSKDISQLPPYLIDNYTIGNYTDVKLISTQDGTYLQIGEEIQIKLEVGKTINLSIGGVSVSITLGLEGEINVFTDIVLEITKNRDSVYLKAGAETILKISTGKKIKVKTGNDELEISGKIYTEYGAEIKAEGGYKTLRKESEIISKKSIYGAARVTADIGLTAGTTITSNDEYLSASIDISTGMGVGAAAGYLSETIINTSTWNVKFSTFAELDIGTIAEIGIITEIEGNINISQEISQIRKEYEMNDKNPNLKILQDIPTWNTKLYTIKQAIKNKISNLTNKLVEKTKDKIEKKIVGKISKFLRYLAIPTLSTITTVLTSFLINILFPTIDSAVNEIKPTDILKDQSS